MSNNLDLTKKYLLMLILSVVVVVPFLFSKDTTDETFLIKEVALREYGLIIFVALLALRLRFGERLPLPISRQYLPFLLFLCYSMLTLLGSDNAYDGFLEFSNFAAGFILFYVTNLFFGDKRSIEKFFFLLLTVSAVVSLFGILQEFGWEFLFSNPTNDAVSPIGHPNITAQFFSFAFPIFVIMVFISSGNLKRIFHSISLFVITFYLIISGCRGSWLGIILSMFLLSILYLIMVRKFEGITKSFGKNKVLISSFVFFLIALLVIGGYKFSAFERLQGLTHIREGGAGFRLYLWKGTLEMVRSHPLFGVGFGNFQHNYPLFRSIKEIELSGGATYIQNAENDFLQILAETGFIGLMLFLFVILSIFREGLKRIKPSKEPRVLLLHIGLALGILSGLVHSLSSFNLRSPAYLALFWFLC